MRNFLFMKLMNHLIQFFLSTDFTTNVQDRVRKLFFIHPRGSYYFEPFATFFALPFMDGKVSMEINILVGKDFFFKWSAVQFSQNLISLSEVCRRLHENWRFKIFSALIT